MFQLTEPIIQLYSLASMQKLNSYRQDLAQSIHLDSSRLNNSLACNQKKDSQRSRVFKKKKTTKYMGKSTCIPRQVKFLPIENTMPIVMQNSSDNCSVNPYTSILKRQITLQDVEQSRALLSQRLQDQQNINYSLSKYPYGKAGVQISEDVLQRYKKQHYLQQSRVLQKFQRQAKQYQQNLKNRKKFAAERNNREQKLSKQRLNKQLARMKQVKNQKRLAEQQRERNLMMKRIGSLMKNISYQIDNNSMILQRGIKQLKDQIPKKNKGSTDNFKYVDSLDFQRQRLVRKIPLVVYKNKILDAREHYANLNYSSLDAERVNAENYRHTSQQYAQLLKVLKDNKKRLNYLTKVEQKGYNNALIF